MARIAVIGAGMGSLAAAARLATGGHQVTVYERAARCGGGVGRFERDGFVFDTGPGLLHLPAVYRDLFIKTGKQTLEESVELVRVDPASAHVLPDGTRVTLPDASRAGVIAALDEALGPGAGERWGEVMNRARQVWEATRRPLLEDTLAADASALRRDPYPLRRRPLLRRGEPTLATVARAELRDDRLAALLGGYALAYGLDPSSAPASAAVLAYVEQTFGLWYVRGGMRALADAVYERCRARGAEFVFGAEVAGVAEQDGRVAGVELADGARRDAQIVVDGTARSSAPLPGDRSRFTVLLALRGARPDDAAHRTIVHAVDGGGTPTVTVLRPNDAALRPDDAHEAVTLTVSVPPQGPVDWRAPGHAERFADEVCRAAARAVPDLERRIVWREVRTPVDVERETGVPGGAVPAPALAGRGGAFLRPGNRGTPPGLYRVGGPAHPGGGLAHAGMSGAIVADLVAGGPGGSR